MEVNLRNKGFTTGEDINFLQDINCLQRHDSHMLEAQSPFLGRHVQPEQDCFFACNGTESVELKEGFLYEIDNKQLLRKSPIQVEGIRAVLVTGLNEFNVSVRVPSIISLHAYFGSANSKREMSNNLGVDFPKLDKQFIMSLKLAKEILVRQISPTEFSKQKHLKSFWLWPLKGTAAISISNGDSKDETSAKGACWSSLNSAGILRWGVRKKISYVGRQNEKALRIPYLPSIIKTEEDELTEVKIKDESNLKTRKRKHECGKQKKKLKAAKCEVKKPSNQISKQKLNTSDSWWSPIRYRSAEMKMLDIMKAKGAVYGRPILRQALRMEARKHIGDTGLLDHVLKHMADKVAPNGQERFRRRHNADGAMEYWLECADLVNIRKEAGVKDPYWTPPSGWKPGDNPSQDPNFTRELKILKEDISNIKKDVQELRLLRREDLGNKAIVDSTEFSSESCYLESDTEVFSLKQDYENLAKRKVNLVQQLTKIRKLSREDLKRNRKSKEDTPGMKKPMDKINEQKPKLSYGRWSQERYKSAEVKMLEIMKAKGAVSAKPIVRQALRMEARKHIGDTGLLDHILKHMAEKVAPNGADRFRRRHNPDGVMEYWLENADLVNVRIEAGVKDPYWTPPLGWRPGDSPSQEPNCARELKLLKEEMSTIEKDVQALLLNREDEGEAFAISTKSSSESCNVESDTGVVSFQEDYENLVNKKAQVEQQHAQISASLNGMQGTIASFRVGPHHPHRNGNSSIDLDNFFRIRRCDFVTS